MVHSTRVNALMLKALDAELVLVGSPRGETPAELANAMAIAARGLGGFADGGTVGCILNRVTPNAAASRTGVALFLGGAASSEASSASSSTAVS